MSLVSAPHPHALARVAWHSVVVVAGGSLLLAATFVVYAVYAWLLNVPVTGRSSDVGGAEVGSPLFVLTHLGFLVLVLLATWWILHRWPDSLGTAVWLAVPTGAVLVTIGMLTYPSNLLAFVAAGLVTVGVLGLLRRWNRPWEQSLAVSWVVVSLLVTSLIGVGF